MRVLLAISFALALAACTGDDPNPGPECAERADAGFQVYEVFNTSAPPESRIYVPTEIIRQPGTGVFRANNVQSSYRWRIGDDLRVFTQREVRLNFFDALGPTSVGLRTQLNNSCGVASSDSSTASFRVEPCPLDSIAGYYQIADSRTPSDTFTIRIALRIDPMTPAFRLDNFPKNFSFRAAVGVEEVGFYRAYIVFEATRSVSGMPDTRRLLVVLFDASRRDRSVSIRVQECVGPNLSCERIEQSIFNGRLLAR